MLRLALHDAGIYGPYIGTDYYFIKRGPNGSIGKPRELEHPSNEGLDKVVAVCEEVKEKHAKNITDADLYQLAGVAAVKVTGGPEIEFVPGREDSTQDAEEDRPLKDKKLDESVLEKITESMGLEEKHMVALIGGLCQWDQQLNQEKKLIEQDRQLKSEGQEKPSDRSEGQEKPSGQEKNTVDRKTQDSYKFGNSYFRGLGDREKDNPLLKSGFRKWVDTYAEYEKTFRKDYAVAHKRVSELGMSAATSGKGGPQTDQKSPKGAPQTRNRARLVQGIGIAVVATAIIIGFFLSRRSK